MTNQNPSPSSWLNGLNLWLAIPASIITIVCGLYTLFPRLFAKSSTEFEGLVKEASRIHQSIEELTTVNCIDGNCDNGNGTWVFANGNLYKGHFLNTYPEGEGLLVFHPKANPELHFYAGQFTLGIPKGKGYIEYSDGSVYTGEVSDLKKNGSGVLLKTNGEMLEGEWHNDELVEKQ